MNLEEKVKLHRSLTLKIEELEEQRKLLGMSIKEAMYVKTMHFGDLTVRRCSRVSIATTLEEARHLNAIKLEEAVDKDKIKILYHQGLSIAGVKEIEYIQIVQKSAVM